MNAKHTLPAKVASLFAAAAAVAGCATADPRQNVSDDLETPRYETLTQDGAFEVRRYAPYIVARTVVDAKDLGDASSEGFRRIGGYIFGKNQREAEVAMTAPVGAAPVSVGSEGKGTTIAMTAPVGAAPEADGYEITFMMPSEYSLDQLPTPNDKRVELVERPASCRAAVVFSGFTTDATLKEQTEALQAWLAVRGWAPVSGAAVNRYNDPLTLPWNRRNEVAFDLDEKACPGL